VNFQQSTIILFRLCSQAFLCLLTRALAQLTRAFNSRALAQLTRAFNSRVRSRKAGYYFPTNVTIFPEYVLGVRVPFDKFATDYVHWLEGGFMNAACADALGDKKELCWDVSVVQRFLKTPLFVAENQIDQQQLSDELLCPGIVCNSNVTSKDGRGFMEDFETLMVSELKRLAALRVR
jgi:hypothetical protein